MASRSRSAVRALRTGVRTPGRVPAIAVVAIAVTVAVTITLTFATTLTFALTFTFYVAAKAEVERAIAIAATVVVAAERTPVVAPTVVPTVVAAPRCPVVAAPTVVVAPWAPVVVATPRCPVIATPAVVVIAGRRAVVTGGRAIVAALAGGRAPVLGAGANGHQAAQSGSKSDFEYCFTHIVSPCCCSVYFLNVALELVPPSVMFLLLLLVVIFDVLTRTRTGNNCYRMVHPRNCCRVVAEGSRLHRRQRAGSPSDRRVHIQQVAGRNMPVGWHMG